MWVDKMIAKKLKFEAGGNNKQYKVDDIYDSIVYTKELETYHLSGLYYLVSWKNYPKDKNTQEPILVV